MAITICCIHVKGSVILCIYINECYIRILPLVRRISVNIPCALLSEILAFNGYENIVLLVKEFYWQKFSKEAFYWLKLETLRFIN